MFWEATSPYSIDSYTASIDPVSLGAVRWAGFGPTSLPTWNNHEAKMLIWYDFSNIHSILPEAYYNGSVDTQIAVRSQSTTEAVRGWSKYYGASRDKSFTVGNTFTADVDSINSYGLEIYSTAVWVSNTRPEKWLYDKMSTYSVNPLNIRNFKALHCCDYQNKIPKDLVSNQQASALKTTTSLPTYISTPEYKFPNNKVNIFIPGKPVVAPADQGVHASEFIEAGIDHNFAKYTPEEGENRLVVVYINLERSDNASGTLIGNGITSVTIGGVEATQVVHNQVKVPEGANYRGTVSYIGYIKEADIKSGNMYIKYTEDSSPNLEGGAVYCQTLFNVDQTNPVYSIASGGPGEPFTLTIPTIKGGYLVATHSEIQSTAEYTFSNLIDKWSTVSTNGLMSTSGAAASSQGGVVNITITETTAVGTATANSGVAANFRPVDTTFNHAVRVR